MAETVPRHQALRQLASDPAAQATIQAQAGPVPDDVSAWLADLETLTGVPFGYLVPDARMLPPESIRFFAVDPNWTAALADGALSLAAKTAPGATAIQALRPGALAASRRLAAARARPAAAGTTTSYSGFLLRSAAVSDWPGLRVAGYADQQATAPLSVARLERLAPTVLLALFAGLVQRVDLTEPPQHTHFGVSSVSAPSVPLRLIDAAHAGEQPSGDPTAPVTLRQDPDRAVIDLTATITAITQGLARAYPDGTPPALGAAGLSLQFVQATATQQFAAASPVPGPGTS